MYSRKSFISIIVIKKIADRAMCYFENDFFLTILKQYINITFMMLVPVIV